MVSRKANTLHGAIIECAAHKRKRSFKTKVSQPKTKCPVCWACWLADRLETSVYKEDLDDLFKFSNAFTTVVKTSSVEYVETAKDE